MKLEHHLGGIDNVPINKTSGAANTADCICQVGNNITGLSGGSVVDRLVTVGPICGSQLYRWNAGLIIPKNTTLTMNVMDGTGARIFGTLGFYFHSLQTHN